MPKIQNAALAAEIARELALKALEIHKFTPIATTPKGVGEAVGEVYNAILDAITKNWAGPSVLRNVRARYEPVHIREGL
jgi:hypothetical protein